MVKLEKRQAEQNDEGNKIKSKTGGPVEVIVSKRVVWPHEYILGGTSKQRVSFDQLNIMQFVQGFVKGVLDEKDES